MGALSRHAAARGRHSLARNSVSAKAIVMVMPRRLKRRQLLYAAAAEVNALPKSALVSRMGNTALTYAKDARKGPTRVKTR